jgi:meiotic recombination protein SPO11
MSSRKRNRVVVDVADDLDVVMAKTRELKAALRSQDNSERDVVPDGIPSDILEVDELSASEVLDGIEQVGLKIAHQVLAKQGFSMEIPSRAASNQIYVKEWDRIVLGGKQSSRSFTNVKVSLATREESRL